MNIHTSYLLQKRMSLKLAKETKSTSSFCFKLLREMHWRYDKALRIMNIMKGSL